MKSRSLERKGNKKEILLDVIFTYDYIEKGKIINLVQTDSSSKYSNTQDLLWARSHAKQTFLR